jgi:hypothetical protein
MDAKGFLQKLTALYAWYIDGLKDLSRRERLEVARIIAKYKTAAKDGK